MGLVRVDAGFPNEEFMSGLEARQVPYVARFAKNSALTRLAGVEVLPPIRSESYILTNPFVSYRRKFGRFNWTLQLNVNNVLDQRELIVNNIHPRTLAPLTYRYQDPRQFVLTNTFGF